MHRSCSCDHHYQPNSFSMLFTMPPYHQHICPYASSSSSSSPSSSSASVDCTLSLATPASTRLTADNDYDLPESRHSSRFCWDFLQPDNSHSPAPPSHKTNRSGATNSSAADSLLSRRCANCDTTSTPLWRNGPRGPKSLCNACGIRFKKEERRAAATATTVVGSGGDATEGYNQNSWMQSTQKMPSCYSPAAVGSEFRFRDEVDDRDSTFLSWRLNVTDRAGLVHDFTRY
ncbi:GATA transcription factor 19-like [Cynara cardunculus var. scolymus]|uniref:Zinc finger, GATA-type n=1 Tax=Cynara cardunculus var. scolymus TaxID=59895 RepID=A0A103Y5F0_CYNCS|nr:GATA transcription factor 19-like [Cynara cardunculus var. scolymus]KVI02857.1 Zinc finger, GATA-type [Cynara cardunculus var. scolymus]